MKGFNIMNELKIFKNDELGLKIRTLLNADGSISMNAEDTAIGFGWVQSQNKNGKGYISVRWERMNGISKELGFPHEWGKDDYIPESLFYMLGMKAGNERAVKYQKWIAMEVLPSIRKTGTYELKQKRKKPVDIIFKQNMNMAKILSENTGVKEGIAFAIAIERTEELSGEDLTVFKKLIPPAEHETGFLNATMIGKKIGFLAKEVNVLLADNGLQYRNEKKQWRLTEEGKKYGEEFPFKRNGHSDYQIRWNDTIIEFIDEKAKLMCN